MDQQQIQRSFAELGVDSLIVKALDEVGITAPFPIQALSIPIALAGTDMIGQARTGTGKTLAFGIAALQRITVSGDAGYTPGEPPQALIMCPTRELALQVTQDIKDASTYRKARVLTVYGGVGYEPQTDMLKDGVDIVVGTPGRLLDLVKRRSLRLTNIKILVLDEADEMLDLGFLPDVEELISHTPNSRQTLLFSATMPAAIMALARSRLNQPVNVRAETKDAQLTVPDTTQFVYQTHDLDKPEIVSRVLQAVGRGRTIIFTRTKRVAGRLAEELHERGFKATAIHGDLSQVAREKALDRFRSGRKDVLVATDVAARGIDITDVTHVINYECPDSELTYVHRIGRTGRAGAKGVAITFVDWSDVPRWKLINRMLGLEFTDPPETYSTSPNLYTDLGIPETTKGWLRDPEEYRDSKAKKVSKTKGTASRPARKQPDRQRVRYRQHVAKPEGAAISSNADASSAEPGDKEVTTAASAASEASKPRRRNRRRTQRGVRD